MMLSPRAAALLAGLSLFAAGAPAADAGTITISGAVYDGNGGPLLTGNVYHAVGAVNVPAGQTLTIQEGAIVKFAANVGLGVDGILDVQGTDANRAVFSSIKDDNAGGDTNQDGNASSPKAGDWKGIAFSGTSDGSSIVYADVLYPGTASNSAAIEMTLTQLTLDHVRISDGSWNAINLDESNTDNDATISDCEITRCHLPLVGVAPDSLQKLSHIVSTDCSAGNYAAMIGNDDTFHADADLGPDNFVNGVQVGGFTVDDGVTVTLEPGTIVKLGGGSATFAYLEIYGTLNLLGTDAQPVVVTSFKDDSWGGDTNVDGGATSPAPGDWWNVAMSSIGGQHPTLVASHALLRYAGYNGHPTVDLTGRDSATLTDCTIEHGQRDGIVLSHSVKALSIERCTIADNGGVAMSAGSLANLPFLLDNTASGNALGDYLWVDVDNSTSWTTLEFGPRNYPGAALVARTGTAVPLGKTLTLLPGTVVKIDAGVGTRWSGDPGSLQLLGTPERPVVFTSIRDDSVGGDTNADGSATTPAPGEWGGITLGLNADASRLEHVILRYGGNSQPQLYCRAAAAVVRSLRSEFSKTQAIWADHHSGAARNWIAANGQSTGIELAGGSFDLLNATATGNAGAGIQKDAPWSGRVASSIAWGNAGGDLSGFSGSEVSYSDGGFAGSSGNLATDPLFTDPANGDYTLQDASPCIETGDPADAASGSDAAGLPRVLDHDFDRVLRIDMGAYEAGHIVLALSGDFTPGGTVTITSSGTAGLPALMLIGFAEGDFPLRPFGRLFIDLSAPWLLLGWPAAPALVTGPLPPDLPAPLTLYFQEFVLSGAGGNSSNLGRMEIE